MPSRTRHLEQRRRQPPRLVQRPSRWRAGLPVKRTLVLVALVLIAGTAAFGGIRLYNSSWLAIQDVRVHGTTTLDDDTVREAAALEGERYLTLDTAAAAGRVRSLARVKDVSIERHFPH